MSSHHAASSSTPPQESTTTPPTHSVSTSIGAAQTMLSFLGQAAAARENPNTNTTTAVLGAADAMLSRFALPSSSSHAPHAHATTTVSHAPGPPRVIEPVPEEVPREHSPESHPSQAAPASPLAEVPQRVSDPSTVAQTVPGPTSVSSHGGGSGGGRAITPPRGTAGVRVTRSPYPAPLEPLPPPRPVHVSHGGGAYRRRSTGPYPYPDSETAWNQQDDVDTSRGRNVEQRLQKTIESADSELAKSTKKAFQTGWMQNIALALQILIGALTTALGAALSGKKTSVAISILGGTSTLVASYLARTKGSNEPQFSLLRSQALDQYLREVNAFVLDHGHEYGSKWDDKINGFRFGLERLLGNAPGSVTINPDGVGPGGTNTSFYGQEKGFGMDPNAGLNGNGKYAVGGASNKPLPGISGMV